VNIVLIGPPGAGKGTQATLIEARTGLTHVASGDLFRHHVREQTDLGRTAKDYVDRGELVPDDLVIKMILERIGEPDCAEGVIFDGFPRTRDQAAALRAALQERGEDIDAVVALTAPREVLLKRLVGRQTCTLCGASYNIFYSPSRLEAVCDLCGAELYTRSDDTWATGRHRLDVYQEQTFPLVDFFREAGLLHEVEAARDVEEVTADITAVLDRLDQRSPAG
jgi:adenylate kinase